MIEAPTLTTARLILRGYRRADFDAIYAIGADAEITRLMGGPIVSRSAAWEKFLRGPAMWPMIGYGMWIVERASDSAVLGQIGYADFMREMDPPLADVPEMAWVLGGGVLGGGGPDGGGATSLGQGYGSEALAAVLAWGDAHLGAPKYQCIIAPENTPSLRLAARFGFVEIRRAALKDETVAVFERTVGG
jgi:RimJ/RimL family protein N-acetyltransferase